MHPSDAVVFPAFPLFLLKQHWRQSKLTEGKARSLWIAIQGLTGP